MKKLPIGILIIITVAIIAISLFVFNKFILIFLLPSQIPPISPIQPHKTSPKPTPEPEINCLERVEYFLSKVPGFFESIEKGIEWCNECINDNGIPTLSYDAGPFCNLKTSDTGKVCTDSAQCEGICLGENKDSRLGSCSTTKSVIGCVFEMKNGEPQEKCFD